MFNALSKEDIHKIVDIELKVLFKRVEELGYRISITEAAKAFLTEKGFDPRYGARPLKRAIQKHVEDELSELIIKGSIQEGAPLTVEVENERVLITSDPPGECNS